MAAQEAVATSTGAAAPSDDASDAGSFGDWDEPVVDSLTGFFGTPVESAEAAFAEFETRTSWSPLGWLKENKGDMYMYIKLVNWIRRQEDPVTYDWASLSPSDLDFDGLFTPTLGDDALLAAWHLVEGEDEWGEEGEEAPATAATARAPAKATPAVVPGQFDDA